MAPQQDEALNRRGFLAGAVTAALAGAGEALAQAKAPAAPAVAPKPAPPAASTATVAPVTCAVIGLGPQGRDIVAALGRAAGASVAAVCDPYPAFLRRGQEGAPRAAPVPDYRQVLDRKDVQAVFIATPTHQHRELALAALQAGKHVYCESPLAHTLDDARAIAQAGKAAKLVFQVGQQYRANPQHHHVYQFVRTAVLGKMTGGRGQWSKKTSWRRAAPTPARERETNWRLDRALSTGLVGEIGIHSLDVANWFLGALPVSVSGFGSVLHWGEDGRKVPDTVACVLEYPGGLRFNYQATLTNSYDGQFEVFFGTDSAALVRDERAWLFKEADAPLLGWEVYARKETVGDETGIALVADASKQLKEGKIPGKEKPNADPGKTALFFAAESFLNCVRERKAPACGPAEGYQALVTALKANEAILNNSKIPYQKEWFTL